MRIYGYLSEIIRKHPWAVIIACLLLTVVFGLGLLFIQGDITYQSMLPGGFPSIKAIQDLDRKFGGIAFENALITAPSVTDPAIVQFMVGLEDYIRKDPELNAGQIAKDDRGNPIIQGYLSPFIANIKTEMAKGGFDVPLSSITDSLVRQFTGKGFKELVEQDYLSNPSVQRTMVGRFISKDRKAALISIKAGAGLTDSQQIKLANALEKLFQDHLAGVKGAKVLISGDPTIARDFDRHIKNKTILLFVIALAVVVLMLFLAFRRLTDTVLPIAIMVIGLVWTIGLTGWIGIHYSVAAIAVMPLLLGTALTFVVPFMARYYEEMEHRFRSVRAVSRALITVGVGVFLAAITNVFGFLVFEFSAVQPLKDFGLTCAIGTVFAFCLAITLLPAIMVVRDRAYEKGPEDAREKLKTHFDGLSRRKKRGLYARATDSVLGAFTALATHHSTVVIIVFTVLTLAGFIQIRGLTTDSDLRKLVPRNLPGIKADFEIEKVFGGQQQDVILLKGDVLSPKSLEAMSRLEEAIVSDPENIYEGERLYTREGIIGLPDVLTEANNGKLPTTPAEIEQAAKTVVQNGGYLGGVLNSNRSAALIALDASAAQSAQAVTRKMDVLSKNSGRILKPAGMRYQLGGITPITRDMTKNIIPTETWSSVLSLGLCALILMIIFRSIPYGLITLTVAFAGVAAEISFMQLMSWPLDIITSLVSALVIGIGVNFGILFTHRYMQEINLGDRLPAEAIRNTMMNLGRANVVAAVSTVVGFLIIMASAIVPLRRFGGVTAFAIGWCLIASLTLMPALLYRLSMHREMHLEERIPEAASEPEAT